MTITVDRQPYPLFASKPPGCVCHKCPKVRRPTDFCALCPVHGVKSELPK